jgi:hypothetical protein
MKKVLFCLALATLTTTCHAQSSSITDNFKKLHWLTGEWKRTNVKPGRSSIETWAFNSNTELFGSGITVSGSDTVSIEKLKLLIMDDHIYYVADVAENKEPVYFKLTKIFETGFVCENPDHDFPKMISYQLEGVNLKATISGNGKSIDYLFTRKK